MATATISTLNNNNTIMLQNEDASNGINTTTTSNDTSASLVPATSRLQPPTNENTEERLKQIDELKYFLGTATNDWDVNRQVHSFPLPTGESLSCVFWNDLFHVTGTDIVRTLLYRFHLFGRPVTNLKKFEEGIFSDLRNLKPGMDASLEEPKSEFLEMLYKNNCIRTQKKQKVFFWFSVPHDRLFLDALERDLKREKMGLEPTSVAIAEPATSLSLDTTQELFDQLRKSMSLSAVATAHAMDEVVVAAGNHDSITTNTSTSTNSNTTTTATDDHDSSPKSASSSHYSHDLHFDDWTQEQEAAKSNTAEKLGHRSTRSLSSIPNIIIPPAITTTFTSSSSAIIPSQPYYDYDDIQQTSYSAGTSPKSSSFELLPSKSLDNSNNCDETEKQKIFGAFSLFEGSPTYKQRQRRRTLSFNTNGFLNDDDCYGGSRLELAAINAGLAIINPQHLFQQSNHEHHHSASGPEKVYTCPLPQCARLFKRLEHLKRHFRTHTLERPYSCNMCGKHFSRTDNLAQHKKTHNRARSSVSSALTRCHSSSKLNTITTASKLSSSDDNNDLSTTTTASNTRRKRASSLRNSYNYNEIIDKLSVLTASNDVPPIPATTAPPPLEPTTTTSNNNCIPAAVAVDYFSYQGGDMSRCASNSSPSGSIPLSDEEIMFQNNHSYEEVIPFNITTEQQDICMTDEMNDNTAPSAIMYDEEGEQIPYDTYGPFLPTSSSPFMWQQQQDNNHNNIVPHLGPSCSTTSSCSSLLFNNNNNNTSQHQDYRLSWYSSMDDNHSNNISPRSTSPTTSLYNYNINSNDVAQIYSWQQT